MRANGVAELFCHRRCATRTRSSRPGRRPFRDTLRNPLYHWTHLELKRYFGIDELLDESDCATGIWHQANEQLAVAGTLARTASSKKFSVQVLCTTDDPADDLGQSRSAFAPSGLETRVYPGVPARQALDVHLPRSFNAWVDRLGSRQPTSRSPVSRDLQDALRKRHDDFHAPAAAFGPRPRPAARSPLSNERTRRRDLRQGAHGPGRQPGRTGRLLGADDALLRPARRGEGLDEAAAPRRAAQRQHPRLRVVRAATPATTPLATGRRPTLWRVSRSPGPGERAAEDDRLQRQPGG